MNRAESRQANPGTKRNGVPSDDSSAAPKLPSGLSEEKKNDDTDDEASRKRSLVTGDKGSALSLSAPEVVGDKLASRQEAPHPRRQPRRLGRLSWDLEVFSRKI